jgi:hypothetical protein
VIEIFRPGRRLRGLAYAVAAWLVLLITPYGPVETVRYYRLLLVDPPFAQLVVEWQRPGLEWSNLAFGMLVVVAAALLVVGWRGFTVTEVVVLTLTLVVALQAVRGIYWFSIAALVILPPGVDRTLHLREPVPLRGVGRVVALLSLAGLVVAVAAGAGTADGRISREWPSRALPPIRRALEDPGARVFPSDRHADWLLWSLPQLRGRIAYDVRLEIYTRAQIEANVRYNGEIGPRWRQVTDGYRIVVLDQTDSISHLADLLREPGATLLYRDPRVAVVRRPA